MILAAGMGSRYGGLKQIDPVGPSGETLMDYSVYDALRAGFGRLIFVIRRDIEQAFRSSVGSRFEGRLGVDYAFQELDALPSGFSPPVERQKPWGTGHAILTGSRIATEPFAVINADDFYGRNAFRLLAEHFAQNTEPAMVGFQLGNTLSEHGAVSRGICKTDAAGYLASILEMTGIQRTASELQAREPAPVQLSDREVVSLNTWGFFPSITPLLEEEFRKFLASRSNDPKAEFYITEALNNLIHSGQLKLKVLHTPDSWFGVTYREDKPRVVAAISELVRQNVYPEKLWS